MWRSSLNMVPAVAYDCLGQLEMFPLIPLREKIIIPSHHKSYIETKINHSKRAKKNIMYHKYKLAGLH
jgi:hypothetical protein